MGKGFSVLEVINTFENVNKVVINYDFGPRRVGDIPKIFADIGLIKNEMNWFPKFNLENSVEHAWNWEKKLMDFKYIS